MAGAIRQSEVLPQNFRVDLGGVIALLSKNLYSSPGVYIRELIQNAVDAIAARDVLGPGKASREITISPYGVASSDSPAGEFSLTDAGIGISAEEVEQFLATVGASSKHEELQRNRRTYIGQFGIGLLSCFLIADEITVISRSAVGSDAIEWIGNSDGTYLVRTLAADLSVGTTVRLRPRPDMMGWARAEQVTPLARKYAEFLPVDVSVMTRQGRELISRPYPWALDFGAHRSAALQGISPKYGGVGVGKQFDAVEVSDPDLGLDGVVYIGAPSTRSSTARDNRVYINDMLVDDHDSKLLPSWAFFAWAIVNSRTLEPTASRETLMNNEALVLTRKKLGRAALAWLRALADTDPERFTVFVADNQLELKTAMTQESGSDRLELAKVVLPMLTMQTTEGPMRVVDLIGRNPNVLYAAYIDEFRTIASFNPGGRTVINAGHTLDQELLLTLPQVVPGVTVTRVYPASEIAALAAPSTDVSGDVSVFEHRARQALSASGCNVAVRRFPSAELPAVFIGRGKIDGSSPGYDDLAHLVLNWDNRVTKVLARTTDDLVFNRSMQLLFVQARMAAQSAGPEDRALLSEALDDIILLAAGVDGAGVT